MKFCLIINATKPWQDSLSQALSLARTIYASGHHINAVFLYGQAVRLVEQPQSVADWQQWQQTSQCPLMLCSTQLEKYQIKVKDDLPGFEVVGLASLTQAMEAADRTVELS